MNWLAIVINSVAALTTFVLMTVVLMRSLKKRTRQTIRIERLTEEERKAQEIAQWLAAIKHDSAQR
jgi:hypothetical protein